jgi:hypothetical protein
MNNKLKLWKFFWDCYRGGSLEGIFIASSDDVNKAIGKVIYFGEVLGKHSEISGTLDKEDVTVVTDDQDFISKAEVIFGSKNISGYNPLDYTNEEAEEEIED